MPGLKTLLPAQPGNASTKPNSTTTALSPVKTGTKSWGITRYDLMAKTQPLAAAFESSLLLSQAITDNPCVYFAPELIAAYPEAKVILQTRDLDSWYTSFRATMVAFIHDPIFHYLCSFDEGMKQWWPVTRKLHLAVFNGDLEKENAIAVHQKSMDRVRELVPKGKLLEWKVQDGWGPLCGFLGVEEPETTFPKVNESAEFAVMSSLRRNLLWQAGKRVAFSTSAIVMVGLGMWWAVVG